MDKNLTMFEWHKFPYLGRVMYIIKADLQKLRANLFVRRDQTPIFLVDFDVVNCHLYS